MISKDAKKAIASYYILSLLLTLPLLIPIWLIKESLWVVVYLVCFLLYMIIAINFAVRATVMSSLWKELDAEKYAEIIHARPFRVHYSYKLNLYFAVGDYQAAYNIISSILIPHRNVQQRIYGYLLLCRICFERGDYEGLKENLDQIDNYFKYNPNIKLPKQSKEAYDFYREFSDADYASVCALLEKNIEKYSGKKSKTYFALRLQYQLAVTKRMKGDIDEAVALFEGIQEKAQKLFLAILARRQLDYISGTLEEVPARLEVTENYPMKSRRGAKIARIVVFCIGCILVFGGIILIRIDTPRQENKDLGYVSQIESALRDGRDCDYEEYQILGYFSIYSDDTHMEVLDSLFLVEADGKIDLHTLYRLNEQDGNSLNVKDIQVDRIYEYENIFSNKIKFVLTEKKHNIPKDALYYFEVDGYYFCLISAS